MHYQTVDRFNSVPEKLHTEFLNLTGFRMPDPVSASGLIQFTAHDTVEEPVPVPQGTQLFTEDEEGEHVVYATRRRIEATPARLQALYYVDARAEIIQRLEPGENPSPFLPRGGENLQRHCFTLGQDDVLSLAGPFEVEVELPAGGRLYRGGDYRPTGRPQPGSMDISHQRRQGALHRRPGGGKRPAADLPGAGGLRG